MVKYILFLDPIRQEEINMFYDVCQMQRDYYRGYSRAHHPLTLFKEPQYAWQCAPDMACTYLTFPAYHTRYKQPTVIPTNTGRTSGFPPLPGRTLAGTYNKAACQAFIR